MFTKIDRINEIAEYIAYCPETTIHIEDASEFKPFGVAVAKRFVYRNQMTQIKYNKWIVEGYDVAKKMNLPGCEKHNQLIQGSGVLFSNPSCFEILHGEPANKIIKTFENVYQDQILEMTNNLQR